MLFPTLDFLVFFAGVVLGLLLLRGRHGASKLFLLAASYVFYAQWNWRYCALLAAASVVAWVGGLALGRTEDPRARRWITGTAVTLLLGLLAFFKYYDFFTENLNEAARVLGADWRIPFIEVILPVGVSFFVFHGISYVVDVHRRDVGVCRRLTDMLLYLSFFPQLVAGPIVRAAAFLPQLATPQPPLPIAPALILIVGGLFKKVIIANELATGLVDPVFFDPASFGRGDLLLAAYAYAVQIYCDFSAYSDIATGLAMLLGYRFPPNFNQPYRAASLAEFWRRWHISLSSWLRDYLYKPLGGSRRGEGRTAANLATVMLLGGIWHGAAWKFIAWGALHGGGLIVERWLGLRDTGTRPWFLRLLSILVVFHLVCLAWIFFRADSFSTAWDFLTGLAGNGAAVAQATAFTASLVAFGLLLHALPPDLPQRPAAALERLPRWALGAIAGAAVLLIDALGPRGVAPFIYFQF
ncbi:MBOAT family O-acyltransferase [Muricoccus radiodurans]|uniref:MBOAT family O-acyltransferase n=1 Tax=Muricoccus radiodurans TaxID=2231721 RepID=UPI003CEAA4D3